MADEEAERDEKRSSKSARSTCDRFTFASASSDIISRSYNTHITPDMQNKCFVSFFILHWANSSSKKSRQLKQTVNNLFSQLLHSVGAKLQTTPMYILFLRPSLLFPAKYTTGTVDQLPTSAKTTQRTTEQHSERGNRYREEQKQAGESPHSASPPLHIIQLIMCKCFKERN